MKKWLIELVPELSKQCRKLLNPGRAKMVDEVTPVVVDAKQWYLSKTLWLNLLTTAVGVVGYLAGSDLIAQNPALMAAFVSAQGVMNVILRLVTGKAIV